MYRSVSPIAAVLFVAAIAFGLPGHVGALAADETMVREQSVAGSPRSKTHDALDLVLPTDNDALFNGGGPDFYQYVDRGYHGEKSTPWQGGQYGFVRDPVQTPDGIVYTRFHEGIDIRCVRRDENGEPLDEIRAIALGKVVYTNDVASYSNYGKYVVIEHRWDGSPYYSLYGHLRKIDVQTGQKVERGEHIAIMGYTGTGINRERAHLHLELNLIVSHRFESWYNQFYHDEPNHHGIYNGINLDGLDIARLYLELRKDPSLTIPRFIEHEETLYKIAIQLSPHFELAKNYPWMLKNAAGEKAASWEISFARSGVPLKIERSEREVKQPELVYSKASAVDYSLLSKGELAGRGRRTHLTDYGRNLMRLFTW